MYIVGDFMRKFERDDIVHLLQSLIKATQIMSTNKNVQQIKMLATDCYDTIVMVDDFLKQKLSQEKYKDYSNILSKISGFYEKSNLLRQINSTYLSETKYIISQLNTIEKKISQEELQYIITFMPYKSSMWDSM